MKSPLFSGNPLFYFSVRFQFPPFFRALFPLFYRQLKLRSYRKYRDRRIGRAQCLISADPDISAASIYLYSSQMLLSFISDAKHKLPTFLFSVIRSPILPTLKTHIQERINSASLLFSHIFSFYLYISSIYHFLLKFNSYIYSISRHETSLWLHFGFHLKDIKGKKS